MQRTIDAFVQAVEVWVPDGETMRHQSGAYGPHVEFARVSARKTFRQGEGLPGRVWQTGSPEIWSDLGPLFVRAELARAAGIEAAVGLPVFRADRLAAVIVLLCGRRSRTAGCIEIWNPDDSRVWLTHACGHYGTLTRFGELSRLVQFGAGSCLPGRVWQRGEPEIVHDLLDSRAFTRSTLARESGLEVGLAIPLFRQREVAHVLVLLSAQATPLARSFQIWVPHDDQLTLSSALQVDNRGDAATIATSGVAAAARQRVLETQMPLVFEQQSLPVDVPADQTTTSNIGVAIPVHDGESMRAIVVVTI